MMCTYVSEVEKMADLIISIPVLILNVSNLRLIYFVCLILINLK